MKKLLLIIMLLVSIQCYAAQWECMETKPESTVIWTCDFYRLEIYKGWIVRYVGSQSHITYVRDEKHEWKI